MAEMTADTQVQKIVEHLRSTLLEPAEKQRNDIIGEANRTAAEIQKRASDEAVQTVRKAEEEAARIRASAESACRIAGRQAVTELKLAIENEVLKGTLSPRLASALSDETVVKNVVRDMVAAYAKNGFRGSIEATVSEDHRKALKEFLDSSLAKDLSSAVTVTTGAFTGCRVVFKDSRLALEVKPESLQEVFSSFLTPELRRSLFG